MDAFIDALKAARDLAPNEIAKKPLDAMIWTWTEFASALTVPKPPQT